MRRAPLLLSLALLLGVALWLWRASVRPAGLQDRTAPAAGAEGAAATLAGRGAPPRAGAAAGDDDPVDPLVADAPARAGIRFFASLVKPEAAATRFLASQIPEELGPAAGYPVRVSWRADEPIEPHELRGVTGDDGVCLLAPLVFPEVPRRLRASVRLVAGAGYAPPEEQRREVGPGDRDVEFTLAFHRRRVQLVDAVSGRPVRGGFTRVYGGDREPGRQLRVLGWAQGYGPLERTYVTKARPFIQTLRPAAGCSTGTSRPARPAPCPRARTA